MAEGYSPGPGLAGAICFTAGAFGDGVYTFVASRLSTMSPHRSGEAGLRETRSQGNGLAPDAHLRLAGVSWTLTCHIVSHDAGGHAAGDPDRILQGPRREFGDTVYARTVPERKKDRQRRGGDAVYSGLMSGRIDAARRRTSLAAHRGRRPPAGGTLLGMRVRGVAWMVSCMVCTM